jgi:hypothetical protein
MTRGSLGRPEGFEHVIEFVERPVRESRCGPGGLDQQFGDMRLI